MKQIAYTLFITYCLLSCTKETKHTNVFDELSSLQGSYYFEEISSNKMQWSPQDSLILIKEVSTMEQQEVLLANYEIYLSDNTLALSIKTSGQSPLDLTYTFTSKEDNRYIFEHKTRPFPKQFIIEKNNKGYSITRNGKLGEIETEMTQVFLPE